MGPIESHEKKVFRKNPNMDLQAILINLCKTIRKCLSRHVKDNSMHGQLLGQLLGQILANLESCLCLRLLKEGKICNLRKNGHV